MTEKSNKPKRGAPANNKNAAKPKDAKMVVVRATVRPDQPAKFKSLGGSKWLRSAIDVAI